MIPQRKIANDAPNTNYFGMWQTKYIPGKLLIFHESCMQKRE